MYSFAFSKPPVCAYETGYHEVFIHCVEGDQLVRFSVKLAYTVEFPSTHKVYEFSGSLGFCKGMNTNKYCSTGDLAGNSYDID